MEKVKWVTKTKPCEGCKQIIEYKSSNKRFCFDCTVKKKSKWYSKTKFRRYRRTGHYNILSTVSQKDNKVV